MTRSATLAPVKVTARNVNLRTNRVEIWQAKTEDGRWFFVRTEAPGTPWHLVEAVSGHTVMLCGSLRQCRQAVTDGTADQQLTAQALAALYGEF